MNSTIKVRIGLLYAALLASCGLNAAFAQVSWDTPLQPAEDATPEQVAKIESFNQEIRLAAAAPDRNATVEHLKKALACRPDDPDNIRIEYKIAVMLSQYQDPKNPQPLRVEEALTFFERVVNDYDHLEYYSVEPKNSIENPEIMVPRAAVHIAQLTNSNLEARQCATKAMECLQATYEKRKEDWLTEPPPREIPAGSMFDSPMERSKFESRKAHWEKRQKAAKEGDVFGPFEMQIAQAAVRQYGYSFGEKQEIGDMLLAMSNVIKTYPDTPMAKIAARFIERGKNRVLDDLSSDILDASVIDAAPTDSSKTHPSPVTNKDLPVSGGLLIPDANTSLRAGKPFVLDLASGELVTCVAEPDSEQALRNLVLFGKGDLAWDGALIGMRSSRLLTPTSELTCPLVHIPAKWSSKANLPDAAVFPYSFLLIPSDNATYLISIQEVCPEGIRVDYKKLDPAEATKCFSTSSEASDL